MVNNLAQLERILLPNTVTVIPPKSQKPRTINVFNKGTARTLNATFTRAFREGRIFFQRVKDWDIKLAVAFLQQWTKSTPTHGLIRGQITFQCANQTVNEISTYVFHVGSSQIQSSSLVIVPCKPRFNAEYQDLSHHYVVSASQWECPVRCKYISILFSLSIKRPEVRLNMNKSHPIIIHRPLKARVSELVDQVMLDREVKWEADDLEAHVVDPS